ncbi:MAG: hypothetical protein OHK006_07940 [Thermodesulfovibrionales bacterium]
MKKSIKNAKLADKVLFLLLLCVSAAGIFYAREASPQGSDVIVEIDGKEAYTFPLGADTVVAVTGPFGDAVIEIRERKVRVREASCQNKVCVREGWISSGVIVCLPNRMIVHVGGKAGMSKDVDAVTG